MFHNVRAVLFFMTWSRCKTGCFI